ncbi:hypothetical protein LY90DRAFT_703002, partial [Neocallimastix californiae]
SSLESLKTIGNELKEEEEEEKKKRRNNNYHGIRFYSTLFYLNYVLRINQVFIFYKQNLNKNEIIVKAKPLSCVRQFLQSFFS